MTAQRQERNDNRPRIAAIAALAGMLVAFGFGLGLGWPAARAATSERIVTDRFTGLAISGFDPVSYFVDGEPVLGTRELEASQGGVVWRFHNEGNRADFLAHPEVYGPQFGGYDPVDVARGVTVAGNPRFWLVVGQRLYLFGFEDNRAAFAANPDNYLEKAEGRWPALEHGLAQ